MIYVQHESLLMCSITPPSGTSKTASALIAPYLKSFCSAGSHMCELMKYSKLAHSC